MSNCKLIGIDSSTSKTGMSFFIDGNYKKNLLIDKHKVKDSGERFNDMVVSILDVLNIEKPQIIVIERMHTIRNADAFRKLCKLMGVVHGWCLMNGCDYIEMSPTEWRKAVNTTDKKLPRKRDELKQWSIDFVKRKYNLDVSDDVSDAICIGEAYINKWKGN